MVFPNPLMRVSKRGSVVDTTVIDLRLMDFVENQSSTALA